MLKAEVVNLAQEFVAYNKAQKGLLAWQSNHLPKSIITDTAYLTNRVIMVIMREEIERGLPCDCK